jgi:hypothetical protein
LFKIEQILEDVVASPSVAQYRQKYQRKKKRGRSLFSTPKELSRSRMRRSNVLPRFNVDHGDTSRTLDFQISVIGEVDAMAIDDVDVDNNCHDQVSPSFQLAYLVF